MIRPALFCIAAATLMLELLLTRVFDVILTPNLAYMVIACALFSFGLAGVYVTLRPPRDTTQLPLLCALFGVAALALLPVLNVLPFDYEQFGDHPLVQLVSFAAMYLALVIPFFLSGLVFTLLFSANARAIQSLYCWDLAGAAAGCAAMVPLLGPIGPGGILFAVGACGLLAGGLLARDRRWLVAAAAAAVVLVAIPAAHSPRYFEFVEHLAKRGVKEARLEGRIEFSRWDPISKIDVIEQRELDPATGQPKPFTVRKHIAYDGGTQSSHVFPFDGDYSRLRRVIEQGSEPLEGHFWHRGVLASHFVKRDSGQKVLVIGSAGGQETKAALMYGASSVDAVEMVRTVVDLVRGPYADYGGRIFLDPRVHSFAMEGRSFLRATPSRYDIIQIHSNHTSSSVAAGTGAMSPNYLQTADAYRDYFSHLTDDGVLHINHHVFPRMVTTAALAWRQMGRTDFQRHVVVLGMATERDSLPTFLVRMRPWTEAEVADLMTLFATRTGDEFAFNLLQDPLHPEQSFLPPVFFAGSLPDAVLDQAGTQVRPTTDNRPFFNFLRKRPGVVPASRETFTDPATAYTLNSQLRKNIVPMDIIHLIVTGTVSLLFAGVFLVLPLVRSRMRQSSAAVKSLSVAYFACLGAGFILIELVFIQVFMKLVGYPVYTYVLVIATLLLGAGLGSAASEGLGISPRTRWSWPFIAVIVYGPLLAAVYPAVFERFLSAPDATRMLVSAALIAPLGFALGMPFPLGILLAQQESPEAVAWGWGLNGLFTVVGSLASVLLGIAIGFQATILVAVGLYAVAFAAFAALRQAVGAPATAAAPALLHARDLSKALPVLILLAATAAPARAQSIGDAPPGFWVTPAVRTSIVREDNIMFSSDQRSDVTFLRVTPTVEVSFRSERSTADLTYGFDSERHPDSYRRFNNAFARQAGGGAFESHLTPRLLLAGRARYISTVRPEEAVDETGLVSERRRTTAYAGDIGVDRDLTTRLRWHAGYGLSAEDFGKPLDTRPSAKNMLHSVSTDLGFRVAERTILAAVYTGRLLLGDDIRVKARAHGEFVAHVLAARLTRTLTPSLTAVVLAGPRYSQGPPDLIPREGPAPLETTLAPEVLASLTYRDRGKRISGTYARSQFIGYGAAGFVDTESVELRAATLIGSRLQLSTRPALYRNTLADVEARAYRADVAAGLRLTRWVRLDASYLYRHQNRTLTLADTVEPGPLRPRTRRTLFVGLTLSQAVRLDEHQ